MKKALFTALLAALGAIASPTAQAVPYPPHDIMSIVRPDHIDMPLADKVMSDLYDHAGNYPPRFDNDADRQRAQAEAAQLSSLKNTSTCSTASRGSTRWRTTWTCPTPPPKPTAILKK